MELHLSRLIDDELHAYVEESRAFNAAALAAAEAAGNDRGPTNLDELRVARANLPPRSPDPRAVVHVARAEGREVPVRVITPPAEHPAPPISSSTVAASS